MTDKWIAFLLIVAALLGPAAAAEFPLSSVPDPLKSWVPWVLDGVEDTGCPHLFDDGDKRYCAWPGVLEVKAGAGGASFAQEWSVYRPTWLTLPGDGQQWPQEVSVDGKALAVLSRDGLPSIRLAPGRHRVSGRFAWKEIPESLALPESAALLQLELNGQGVRWPVRDESNHLWLQARPGTDSGDEAQLRVYRKIIDGLPIRVETRIQLEVSGKSRELAIGRALLAEMIPQELISPLPASLAQDGSLKVQARAGTWEITFVARHPGTVKAFQLPPEQGLSAAEEVWAFQAAPLIRSASIEEAPALDPQQTSAPKEWRNLPTYLMRADTRFVFKETRRGDSEPAPDTLALERRLWLSFDGSTLTINDRIQGNISSATRLSMGEPAQLGRVDVDGQDQLITRGSDDLAGIETRRGQLSMSADSLLSGAPRRLPAVGWAHDFDRVSMRLALPAGWRLVHAAGTDRADGEWLAQWNLLDFFLVLVIALAVGQLWGLAWGGVALAALVLSYQEPGAPTYEWLLALAAVAVHRALPAGRFKGWMLWLRRLSLLALVLITLGFATDQIRSALYPVLENADRMNFGAGAPADFAVTPAPVAAPAPLEVPGSDESQAEMADQALRSTAKSSASPRSLLARSKLEQPSPRPYQALDPEAKVQTGPGLPDWSWHSYQLAWDGPVRQDQSLDLWLLSPSANRVLVVLRVLLLALLLACVAGVSSRLGFPGSAGASGDKKTRRFMKNFSVLLCAMFALGALLHSPAAEAALPTQEQLGELREKLVRAADCLPECADISRLSVHVSGASLRLGLDVDAAVETALPLPGGAKQWLPHEALLDGKSAQVQRDGQGGWWALMPAGRHRLELVGDLTSYDTVQLPLPRKPRRVEVSAEGWDVAGVSDEDGAADTLQLTRRVKAGSRSEAPLLPPFLHVERRLILDLVWRVETTVRRESPLGVPALVQIPLLPGEAVTTSGINVKGGMVLVNLGAQSESLSWSSSLAHTPELKLVAAEQSAWVETWSIANSGLWHVSTDGIPPVAVAADADLSFRPWPGETLALKIERPPAIAGQTLPIDKSTLSVTPGTRASDYQLLLSVRSSRGVEHSVTLPDGASLQRVSIDGQLRPIRANGRQLVLPLQPGRQLVGIVWRLDQGMSTSYSTAPVGLNLASVNSRVGLTLPYDRWLLLASGPGIGPAILFWGKLLMLLVVASALGRFAQLPMKTRHWVVLALGLTQLAWWAAALVIAWFFAFSMREKTHGDASARWLFNIRQLGLVLLTVIFMSVLFHAVQGGLLGQPEMQVAGNNSSAGELHWYLDRAGVELQSAWVLTLPILIYRGLMLAWALWLAWSLLAWLRWGWNAFARDGVWRHKPKVLLPPAVEVQGHEDSAAT